MREREVSKKTKQNKGTDKQVIANTHTHTHVHIRKVVQRKQNTRKKKTLLLPIRWWNR